MTYFSNPAGQPPPPPDLPSALSIGPTTTVEYGYRRQHQQWSRPQPAGSIGSTVPRAVDSTEMSPISVASAPSPHDSEGDVAFGVRDSGSGQHVLGTRRGLPAGKTSNSKRGRRSSPLETSFNDEEWRRRSSSSSSSSDVDDLSPRKTGRQRHPFRALLSGKCDSREFDTNEPRLLEMDGPLWDLCGRRIIPVSPVLQLTPSTVCQVSKVIAAEKRCIGLDVVGVPAPRLPDTTSKRSVVDHLVIATMHGVTVIGPTTAGSSKAGYGMCRDMLAAQLIGHLKLYRNTVHVVIPRADTVDRACRFLGLKHGALAGMINVVQWVRKWAASQKTHGAAVLAKAIMEDLKASGGGELSVESLCGFFLPYKPHFTGPPRENLERLPKNVRSYTMAHMAFFTRKVFRIFYDRAADPDSACRADGSEGTREADCISVGTSEEGGTAPTARPGGGEASEKSPMTQLSPRDIQAMEGVALGIREMRQGEAVKRPYAS